MIALHLSFIDTAGPAVAAVIDSLKDRTEIHGAIAFSAEAEQKAHLQENYVPRSTRTGWWGKAKDSTEAHPVEDGALLRIPHRGVALRYYGSGGLPGGVVRAGKSISTKTGKKTKALAIGLVDAVAGLSPHEYGAPLAFIPSKRPKVGGVLVEAILKTVTRGPNKGKVRPVPKPDGDAIFALREETTHPPDPGIIDFDRLGKASVEAAAAVVEAASEKGGQA